jgi:hypothetical protein
MIENSNFDKKIKKKSNHILAIILTSNTNSKHYPNPKSQKQTLYTNTNH